MSDEALEPKLASARRATPSWTLSRQQQVIWAVAGRLQARRRGLRRLAIGVAVLTLSVSAWGLRGWGQRAIAQLIPSATPVVTAAPRPASRWSLADGSQIEIDGPSTLIQKSLDSRNEVAFELESGGAWFDVARRPERVFRVHAGPVTVQVLGTKFAVQRRDARSAVTVERGRVLVSWAGGSRELAAGEMGLFPPPDSVALRPAPAPREAALLPSTKPEAKAMPAPSAREEENGPSALFARADRARAEGQPERALAPLRQITESYPSDPRAPMAAFTRGRLLLESLGRPREAASAFAQARRLTSRGTPLAEDALAREVDAWRAASEPRLARERAELYRSLYPHGIRLHAVMRSGGLQGGS